MSRFHWRHLLTGLLSALCIAGAPAQAGTQVPVWSQVSPPSHWESRPHSSPSERSSAPQANAPLPITPSRTASLMIDPPS